MKSHQMKFILRHFQIQKKRNRSNRNRNQTQITFFITIYTSSHVTQIFTIFFFFFGVSLSSCVTLFNCLWSASICGASYTDNADVLAVAATLPDLGCRRSSINVSACPHKVTQNDKQNLHPIIYNIL